MVTFFFRLKPGFNQTKGRANGPALNKAVTIQKVLKYHFVCWDFSFIIYLSSVALYFTLFPLIFQNKKGTAVFNHPFLVYNIR